MEEKVKTSQLGMHAVIFGDELIVDLDKNSVDTIRCEYGTLGDPNEKGAGWYDMKIFRHDRIDKQDGTSILKVNGYGEIYPQDECYKNFRGLLESANIWREE